MKNALCRCISFTVLIGIFVNCQAFGEIKYTVTDLGTLGGSYSQAYAINNHGQVTGESYIDATYSPHAFLYSNGVMTDLGGYQTNVGYGNRNINDSAQITGGFTNAAGYMRAFLYSDGVMSDLGTLGGTKSRGFAINNSGQITGWAFNSANQQRVFLYSNGTMTDLGIRGNGKGINDNGQITGWLNAGGYVRMFLYSNGVTINTGIPGEGYAINNSGQITGMYWTAAGPVHAFLYDNGAMTDLGTLGGDISYGQAINDMGEITGWSRNAAGILHAFLYSNGVMTDLNVLIDPSSGWILDAGYGINNLGQICGSGMNAEGQEHAILLTPISMVPIAEAGEEQVVYAASDGIAVVVLDGADSNDPAGNELTYKWTWEIEANIYEANGVNPTIELPAGVHTVQLVVNNGLTDSQPDDVNITVIAPFEAKLKITPAAVNCRSGQTVIRARIELPDVISENDVDVSEPFVLWPGEIEAKQQQISSGKILALFDKAEIANNILANGLVEVIVEGRLKSGQYFYGVDTVRINR